MENSQLTVAVDRSFEVGDAGASESLQEPAEPLIRSPNRPLIAKVVLRSLAAGSVGVVIEAPPSNREPYQVRFSDGASSNHCPSR